MRAAERHKRSQKAAADEAVTHTTRADLDGATVPGMHRLRTLDVRGGRNRRRVHLLELAGLLRGMEGGKIRVEAQPVRRRCKLRDACARA